MTRQVRFRGPDGIRTATVDELPVEPLDPRHSRAARRRTSCSCPSSRPRSGAPASPTSAAATPASRRAASDVYSLVYDAERPELFLKDAVCRRTVGPGRPIGVRSDSTLGRPGAGARARARRRRRDRRLHDRQRRFLARDRGREPALPPAGQALRRARARSVRRARPRRRRGSRVRDPHAHPRRETAPSVFAGQTSTRGCSAASRSSSSWLRRDNPVPPGSVLLTGTGLVPPDDFTLEPGQRVEIHVPEIGTLVNPVGRAADLMTKEAEAMTDVLEAPARPAFANFVGGEWRPSRSGATYEKRGPWRPSEIVGEFPRVGRRGRRRRGRGRGRGVPGLGAAGRGRARRGAPQGRRRGRPPRRADRPGHDAGDGQADPRGADGGGADGADPALLRRRRAPRDRRALRAGSDRQRRLHDAAPARRRRR